MMNGWKTIPLGEIAESVDYGLTASAVQQPVGPKFLRITDIQEGFVNWDNVPWCECDARSAVDSRLKPGDIVFARTGATTGKSFLIRNCPSDAVFASYLIRVRFGAEIEPRYVSHFFQTPRYWAQITKSARGVAQPGVNATTLKELGIPLPPLPEQRRIAEVLDRAEALRAKRRAALAQLDTLTQAIFLDMFGDPATNPKGMRKLPLGELIKLKSGGFLPATNMVQLGKFPVLGGNGVSGHHDQYMFETPQIVIGRVGVYCGCVHVSPPRSWVTDNALYVSERKEDVEFDYLVHALRHARLNRYASQSGQPLVSGSRIYPVEILVPHLNLQNEFARRVAAGEKLKTAHRASLAELEALFAALQHRAFRGEL